MTLTYNSTGGTLSGFPAGQAVTKTVGGVSTVYPAGTAAIPYQDGASYSFGGVNIGRTRRQRSRLRRPHDTRQSRRKG